MRMFFTVIIVLTLSLMIQNQAGAEPSISCSPGYMESYILGADGGSSINFQGSCTISDGGYVSNQAYEIHTTYSDTGEGVKASEYVFMSSQNLTGQTECICPSNPWLNDNVQCYNQAITGNGVNAIVAGFKITGASLTSPGANLPLSPDWISSQKKADMRAEVDAKANQAKNSQPYWQSPKKGTAFFWPNTAVPVEIWYGSNLKLKEWEIYWSDDKHPKEKVQGLTISGSKTEAGNASTTITTGVLNLNKAGKWEIDCKFEAPNKSIWVAFTEITLTILSKKTDEMPPKLPDLSGTGKPQSPAQQKLPAGPVQKKIPQK